LTRGDRQDAVPEITIRYVARFQAAYLRRKRS
jgi:hypothetical protein